MLVYGTQKERTELYGYGGLRLAQQTAVGKGGRLRGREVCHDGFNPTTDSTDDGEQEGDKR